MALTLRDNAYHTYADYLGWPEDVRWGATHAASIELPRIAHHQHIRLHHRVDLLIELFPLYELIDGMAYLMAPAPGGRASA
jgi:hypothetical protein